MNLDTLAFISLGLAAAPFVLYLLNLFAYRRLTVPIAPPRTPLSVLIPARNEAKNIAATLNAVLSTRHCSFEVIVLNDHSTDHTAQIVREIAARDPRVRLEEAPALPRDWCGKQHACHVLAQLARHPLLLFIDADVRLAPDALPRIIHFMEQRKVALASGVPRQQLGTFSERLLLPLIHTLLLGFLPVHGMRRTRWPAMSAGCGQLFVARQDAYARCGGHSQLKDSLHDGIMLPRAFRRAGFATDLFDATDISVCRMYGTNRETWRGLEKNATEGLGAPGTIIPMSTLLIGGQSLPPALLLLGSQLSTPALLCACAGTVASLLPRFISALKFQQPLGSALFHPLGVGALVAIQWRALLRSLLGQPSEWKGRSYPSTRLSKLTSALLLAASLFGVHAAPASLPPLIELHDQFDAPLKLAFPAPRITILTLADRKGSDGVDEWIAALKPRYADRVDFRGIAQVSAVPRFLQSHVRKKFQESRKYPVMMDWTGSTCLQLEYEPGVPNVLIVSPDGKILGRYEGPAQGQKLADARDLLDRHLPPREKRE